MEQRADDTTRRLSATLTPSSLVALSPYFLRAIRLPLDLPSSLLVAMLILEGHRRLRLRVVAGFHGMFPRASIPSRRRRETR